MLRGSTLEEHQQSSLGADFIVVFGRLIDLLGKPNLSDFFLILRRFDIQGVEREARSLLKVADKIFDEVMDERAKMDEENDTKSAGRGKDFVQILHEIKNLDTEEEVTAMQKEKRHPDVDFTGDVSNVDVRDCFTGRTAASIDEAEDDYRLHANAMGFCYGSGTVPHVMDPKTSTTKGRRKRYKSSLEQPKKPSENEFGSYTPKPQLF